MGPIVPISTQIAIPSAASASVSPSPNGEFQNVLSTTIQSVENENTQSQQAVRQFLSGESDDLHKVAMATQRAELSSELFLQVRNKVISAYQEIMKMQM